MLRISKKNDNPNNVLPVVVSYFAGVSGLLWLSELTCTNINLLYVIVILLIPIICIRWQWITLGAASVILLCGTLLWGGNGLYYLTNQVILQYNTISASEISYYKIEGNVEGALLLFEALLLAFFMAYMYTLIKGKHWLHMLIFTIIMDVSLVYLLRENSVVYLVFSTMSLLSCFVYCQRADDDTRIVSVGFVGLLILFIAAGLVYVNASKATPFAGVYEIKKKIVHRLDELRYGKLDMPEGNLAGKPSKSDEVRLTVTFEKPTLLYLRGYTATELVDDKWETIDYEKYAGKREGMFRAYLKDGFHPLAQLDAYCNIVKGSQEKLNTIEISNVSASTKYEWIPYGMKLADVENSTRVIKDQCIRGNNNIPSKSYNIRDYDYDMLLSEDTTDIMSIQSEEAAGYRSAEADYNRFVAENYSGKGAANAEYSGNLAQLCVSIREELAQAGKDKDWSSVNYASEGVLRLREYGYSTRYVEGYYVDGRQLADNSTVDVRGYDSHAWAEVYIDRLGFIPVELTPGYYDELIIENQPEQSRPLEEIAQLEGISSEKENEDTEDILWGRYIIIALILLLLLIIIAILVVVIRELLYTHRLKVALASDKQEERLKALSAYTLKLYRKRKLTESDMPPECVELWDKFWFSSDHHLEEDEERKLFDALNIVLHKG